ncbi:MAG: DUF4838 domain-containing protein [Chitinophagaceae bacterium]|nr:DUF4838 domain-containing protein [Chitinophagaceae bacterium]
MSSIVCSPGAGQAGLFAAYQLQFYLKQITGEEIPVSEAKPSGSSNKSIYLSLSTDSLLVWDGYRVRTTENEIALTSREPRGLLYAVYDMLEQAGCSFVYPGEAEQVVPKKDQLEIHTRDTVVNPVLEHRGFALYGLDKEGLEAGRNFIDWMAKNRFNYVLVSEDRPSDSDGPAHGSVWKEVDKELLPELKKRGFVIEMSEHCTPVFFPRSLFKQHPDWFALNNGERKLGPPPYSGQICYSSKAAIEYYGNALAKYAAAHPEFHTIGTWPLDGGEYCECENCKDPQTVFNAVTNIASKIKQVRPDIKVEHLAYKVQTWQPPNLKKLPENISVLWCRDEGESEELVKQWIAMTDPSSGVYQFEYYLGDNYRSRSNVWLRPRYAVDMVQHARTTGYRGVISLALPVQNWWRTCFNGRFFARASWDPDINIDNELAAFYRDYFGQQRQEAEKVFTAIFNDMQKEPYLPSPDDVAKNWLGVEKTSPAILRDIDNAVANSIDSLISRRWKRLRVYVEGMMLQTKDYHTRKIDDIRVFENFSKTHNDMREVIMYPGYIRWRNEEDFLP